MKALNVVTIPDVWTDLPDGKSKACVTLLAKLAIAGKKGPLAKAMVKIGTTPGIQENIRPYIHDQFCSLSELPSIFAAKEYMQKPSLSDVNETNKTGSQMQAGPQCLMTEPLTRNEIANLFSMNRNNVDTVLSQYHHEKIGTKYRLPVSVMPPRYHAESGIDPKTYQ
jgi:hypothetical protein